MSVNDTIPNISKPNQALQIKYVILLVLIPCIIRYEKILNKGGYKKKEKTVYVAKLAF